MSALLAEGLVTTPTRHLRVIDAAEAQRIASAHPVPSALLRPSAPRTAGAAGDSRPLAPVVPLRPLVGNASGAVRVAEPSLSAPAPRQGQPIVLTRRGVLVVRTAIVAAVGVLAIVIGALMGLALRPEIPAGGQSVVVGSGQTLWAIAAEAAGPGQDVRDVVADIVALNGLTGQTIHAGESLTLPAY